MSKNKFSRKAIISLVLAIVGVVAEASFSGTVSSVLGALFYISALVLGFMARKDIKEKKLRGEIISLIGIVIGFLMLVLLIMVELIVMTS